MKKSERKSLLMRKKEDLVKLIFGFKEMIDKQRVQIDELEHINSTLTEETVNFNGRISNLGKMLVDLDKAFFEKVATSVDEKRALSEQIIILTDELNLLNCMKKSLDEALGIEREKNFTFQRDNFRLQQEAELLKGIIMEAMRG